MFVQLALFLSIFSGTALAADSDGNSMLGGGTGSVLCREFVSVFEEANTNVEGTIGYVTIMQGFAMYLLGFRSGYNNAAPDTYDMFHGIQEKGLMNKLAQYCRDNPKTKFGLAVSERAKRNYSARSRKYIP